MKPKDDHLGYTHIIEITKEYITYKKYSLKSIRKLL